MQSWACCLSSVLLLLPGLMAAQLPFPVALEAKVGLAVPLGDLASSGEGLPAEPGPTYGAGAAAYPSESLGVFAGYQQSRFGCDECADAGLDGIATLGGWEAGVHYMLPALVATVDGWIRGGAVYQTLTYSGFGDRISSEPTIGFTVAAGARVPALGELNLLPAVRYLVIPAEFTFTTFPERSVDIRALAIDVSISYRF